MHGHDLYNLLTICVTRSGDISNFWAISLISFPPKNSLATDNKTGSKEGVSKVLFKASAIGDEIEEPFVR